MKAAMLNEGTPLWPAVKLGVILLLLISAGLNLVKSCPSSCAVCTEEATVCQGLVSIIAVPSSTKILIITEGEITTISIQNFSNLLNLTLLRLNGNQIQKIQDGAFRNLKDLQILVLDHNQISSTAITNTTFLQLLNLEVLQLNNNRFGGIDQTWFIGTKNLLRLELNRNQITNLTSQSLGSKALYRLEHLALSSNFIGFIQEGTFQNLQRLRVLDLSKNRLTTLPDIFPSLPNLSFLNLGQNRWNCTCNLRWVADFFRNSTNLPSKTNTGNSLQCKYSEDPSVKSLLHLTKTNCLFKTQNISIVLKEKDTKEQREAIVISFLVIVGIIGLSCLIVLTVKCCLQPHTIWDYHPTNCCCDKVQGSPEIQSHSPKVHLTQNNGDNGMTLADPPKDGHHFLKKPPASLHQTYNCKESEVCHASSSKERFTGTYYICFNCRLIKWKPPSPAAMTDASPGSGITKRFQEVPHNLKDVGHVTQWNGTSPNVLQELPRFINGDPNVKRLAASKKNRFVIEPNNVHAPDSYHCMPGQGPRKKSFYKQSADVMSHLTTKRSVEMKIHGVKPPPCAHRSLGGGHSVLPDERRDISSPSDNDLICKYMECDKLEKARRQITEPEAPNVKFEQKKIQTRVGEENCFLNNDSMVLSARIRRVNIPRSVGFYIPKSQQESNMVVNIPQSRQENFSYPHLGSKYVLTINKKDYEEGELSTTTLMESLKDVYINSKVCNTKSVKREQDYLRVKVNLQPFRKVRVHPHHTSGGSLEATKPGHSPKQLSGKKLKGGGSPSTCSEKRIKSRTVGQPKKPSLVEKTSLSRDTNMADHLLSKNNNINAKKGTLEESVTILANDIPQSGPATIRERPSDALSPKIASLESNTPKASKDQCSKDKLLRSEGDQKENMSRMQQGKHAELEDQAIPARSEGITENNKLHKQPESQDNTGTFLERTPDVTLSNVTTSISERADSLSSGNNIKCEMDIAASSLPHNKVNGHFESNREDDISGTRLSLRPDNSIKNNAINDAGDREINMDSDTLLDDSLADRTRLNEGCEKKGKTKDNEKGTQENNEICCGINLGNAPRREEPPSCYFNDAQQRNEHGKSQMLTQSNQMNKPDETTSYQQMVTGPPLKASLDSHSKSKTTDENRELLVPQQINETLNPALKTAELPDSTGACTSPHRPTHSEHYNSNNNHSKWPAETRRNRLTLSETSKVIIVVESLNKTIDIQKYLSERSSSRQTRHTANATGNESDGAAGEGSQRKKISLILPEKTGTGAPKSHSKKIK